MEPQIQYCTTSDGVRIAFTVEGAGTGTPLLGTLAPPFSHVRASHWQGLTGTSLSGGTPSTSLGGQFSSSLRRVALFDYRGCGLSDRNISDFSMDALERDLYAVIERLAWPRFALHGMGMAGAIVMKYAAEHPERVTSLVLRETYARAAEMGRIPRMRALGAVLREDWESYLALMALTMAGFSPDVARLAEILRETSTPELVRAFAAATPTYNATMFVEQIAARTLVIGRDDMPVPSGDMLRQLGARIRDARVVMVSGGAPPGNDAATVLEKFLVDGDDVPSGEPAPLPSGMAVVLFTDIADSTALTERMGDAAFRAAARTLEEGMRAAIRDCGGTLVEGKVLGDGVMGVFASASSAIGAAGRCVDLGGASELRLHLGLHAGDVIREGGNVYGGAVNIAARICSLSHPGEILVTATVRDLARTSAGVTFEDRGEQELKGVAEPVHVYAVRSGEA